MPHRSGIGVTQQYPNVPQRRSGGTAHRRGFHCTSECQVLERPPQRIMVALAPPRTCLSSAPIGGVRPHRPRGSSSAASLREPYRRTRRLARSVQRRVGSRATPPAHALILPRVRERRSGSWNGGDPLLASWPRPAGREAESGMAGGFPGGFARWEKWGPSRIGRAGVCSPLNTSLIRRGRVFQRSRRGCGPNRLPPEHTMTNSARIGALRWSRREGPVSHSLRMAA